MAFILSRQRAFRNAGALSINSPGAMQYFAGSRRQGILYRVTKDLQRFKHESGLPRVGYRVSAGRSGTVGDDAVFLAKTGIP